MKMRRIKPKLFGKRGFIIYIVAMVGVVVCLMIASRRTCYEDAKEYLLLELSVSEKELEQYIEKICVSGLTASEILVQQEYTSQQWQETAKTICRVTGAETAEIIDEAGNGIDNHGKIIQTEPAEVNIDTSKHSYFFKDGEDENQKPYFTVQVPMAFDNQFKGMINIYYSAGNLKNSIFIKDAKKDSSYYVINRDGKYLLATGRTFFSGNEDNFLEDIKQVESLEKKQGIQTIIDTIQKEGESFALRIKIGEEKKVIVGKPVEDGEWYIIGVISHEYVENYAKEHDKDMWNVIFALMVLAVSLIGMLSYYIIRNREENRSLQTKANTDLLTGLTNKIATENQIKRYIQKYPDTTGLFVHFDIDNFKNINDTRGHAFGDEVLRMVGDRIREEFRSTDILGRTGGDEFTLYLKDVRDVNELEDKIDRLERIFANFVMGDLLKYSVTASIGVCSYPKDGATYEELYEAADKALYKAKKQGKNQIVIYEKE